MCAEREKFFPDRKPRQSDTWCQFFSHGVTKKLENQILNTLISSNFDKQHGDRRGKGTGRRGAGVSIQAISLKLKCVSADTEW